MVGDSGIARAHGIDYCDDGHADCVCSKCRPDLGVMPKKQKSAPWHWSRRFAWWLVFNSNIPLPFPGWTAPALLDYALQSKGKRIK